MTSSLLSGLLSSTGMLYGVIVPLVLVQIIALLFVPSLLAAPAKARAVGDAIHCYFLQIFGVLLMTIGALPTVFSVLAGISYTGGTYFGLLLVFAVGGALFLWQDQRARFLDASARAVPAAIFLTMFKIIGQVILVLASLSFLLSITLGDTAVEGWWVMPVLMAIYGALIAWCTKSTPVRSVMPASPVLSQKIAFRGTTAKSRPAAKTAVVGKKVRK
jgi:hypothetical protein